MRVATFDALGGGCKGILMDGGHRGGGSRKESEVDQDLLLGLLGLLALGLEAAGNG